MAIATAAELVTLLRQLHLLEPAQLDELTQNLQRRAERLQPPVEPRALAQKLIDQGWLTPYQVNQLAAGKGPELLLGSYVLLERLGEGGMGAVFKARNSKLGNIVALKVVHKERVANENAVRRFQREIKAAAALNHPNIVKALDADEVAGTHLFVMEHVEGVDLNKLVKDKGPLPVEQACDCIRQAALGLQHAFEKEMVHRDIKPHNLLLAKAHGPQSVGLVKILDFGLARMQTDDDSTTLTREGAVMGTADYMSPEQCQQAHDVDIRADLYSLGCTFYFLLTGQVPFPGRNYGGKLVAQQLEQPTPVEQLRPDVPPGVAAVVRKLMAKKPEERFQTPAEVAAVLAKGAAVLVAEVARLRARSLATSATATGGEGRIPLAVPVQADDTIAAGTTPPDFGTGPRRPRLLILAAGGVFLFGIVVLLLAMLLSSGDPSGTAKLSTAGQTRKSTEPEPFVARPINKKMVLIPAGTFLMGSSQEEIDRVINLNLPWPRVEFIRAEGPQHEVQISQPFYMGIHEVTRGQFRQFLKETGYKMPKGAYGHFPPDGAWRQDGNADWENPGYEQDDSHPVVCVSWNDAREFIKWLNEKHPALPASAKTGDWKYALPTEAQWEYACRAKTKTRYSCGDSDDSLNGFVNIADASFKPKFPNTDWARWAVSWDDGHAFTAPVGKFKSNGFGLYDMHGNVWEWCADLWDPNYYQAKVKLDPPGPSAGGDRMIRGGSWNRAASPVRCAQRSPPRSWRPRRPHRLSCGAGACCPRPSSSLISDILYSSPTKCGCTEA